MKYWYLSWFALSASVLMAQTVAPVPASGNVALPLDEYNRLVALGNRPLAEPNNPPLRHLVKSTEMTFEVKGESVSGTVVMEGEVLGTGTQRVPLVSGMIVRNARLDGAELPLQQEGGSHLAWLTGPAPFAVTLDTAMPLKLETGRASFELSVPSSGAARLTLTLPGTQTLVDLSPGLITARTWNTGATTIEATLVPGEKTTVWWAARLNPSAVPEVPKETRFLSDVKTLITVGEAELTIAALTEVTVVQGEPAEFLVHIPASYELTGATGPSLVSSSVQSDVVRLTVNRPGARSHQFLLSLARPVATRHTEIPLVTFENSQRETGEVLVEGQGAMELTATERGSLRRMDFKETSPYLRSLAENTLHAAFRYQKRPTEAPGVALEWERFPEIQVLSAVAQRAVVTTLVTSEGRSLTEVKLTLKNRAQPFLKLDLPPGATVLSCDVAGEKVKPVIGADGSRVPLLRPGFRPADEYDIAFVFMHAGAPFSKKGGAELSLPKMDIPIGSLRWEVFLPSQYRVADFGGDAVPANLLPPSSGRDAEEDPHYSAAGLRLPVNVAPGVNYSAAAPGLVSGTVVDSANAAVSGAQVMVQNMATGTLYGAVTNSSGNWAIPNVASGKLQITTSLAGFKSSTLMLTHNASRSSRTRITLEVGSAAESITVTAEAPLLKTESGELSYTVTLGDNVYRSEGPKIPQVVAQPASANVQDLQRRVAGVLPIAVTVPRAGNSYQFVRPLVMDEATTLTFKYRLR